MDVKRLPELLQMNKGDIEFYSKTLTNRFFQQKNDIKKILDDYERNRQYNNLKLDFFIFQKELAKFFRLTGRRYSI